MKPILSSSLEVNSTRAFLDAIEVGTHNDDSIGITTRVFSQKIHSLGPCFLRSGYLINHCLDIQKEMKWTRTKRRARYARWTLKRGPTQENTNPRELYEKRQTHPFNNWPRPLLRNTGLGVVILYKGNRTWNRGIWNASRVYCAPFLMIVDDHCRRLGLRRYFNLYHPRQSGRTVSTITLKIWMSQNGVNTLSAKVHSPRMTRATAPWGKLV